MRGPGLEGGVRSIGPHEFDVGNGIIMKEIEAVEFIGSQEDADVLLKVLLDTVERILHDLSIILDTLVGRKRGQSGDVASRERSLGDDVTKARNHVFGSIRGVLDADPLFLMEAALVPHRGIVNNECTELPR